MRDMFKDCILVAEAMSANTDECQDILCIVFIEVSELHDTACMHRFV